MHRPDTSAEHDELLAQLGWMRTLALRLTRDPDVADDVLQGACLLALQRPSERGAVRSLRAWTAGVLRRMASDRRREQARREGREQVAAAREELPATVDLAARREILRALVDALTTLEEPGFSTVVRRYYDGLSTLQIASQDGVSPDVVRQRLARARARLRERLTSTLDPRWLPALALLSPRIGGIAGGAAGAAPHGTFHPQTLLRGLLMAERTTRPLVWKAGAAALALALGAGTWAVLRSRPDERPAASTELVSRITPAAAAPAPPSSPALESLTATPVSAPMDISSAAVPRSTLVLELRRQTDSAPIPDVECKLYAEITDTQPEQIRATGRTGADGIWRVEFEHAVRVWLVEALPGAGHAYVEERPDLAIAIGESKPLVIETAVGTTVRGIVVDGDGRPVPQAGVLAWCDYHYNVEHGDGPPPDPHARAACDSSGRFELKGMGPQLVLVPEAAGMAAVSGMAGSVSADGSADIKLVLGPAVELRGRVVDPAGHPVAKTWVTGHRGYIMMQGGLESISPIKVANATDSDGRFVLATIAQRGLRVDVNAQGFPPWSKSVTPDGSELLIQLESGLGLAGMVYGADGKPLDGVNVQLAGATEVERGEGGGFVQTKTSQGSFLFEALVPSTTAVLSVSAPGHAVFVLEPITIDATPKAPLEIRLDPEWRIAGRVVDEHGQPLRGALVAVHGDRTFASPLYDNKAWEEAFWPRVSESSTGDDGRFQIERLYDGLFELTVVDPRSPDWNPDLPAAMFGAADWKHVQQARSGTEDLLIRLDPAELRRAVLAGTVTDALSGEPLQEFSVFLRPLDTERVRSGQITPGGQFHAAQGAFHVEGIEPGRWQAHVWADGYADGRSDDLELREGEQRVDLTVLPERSLHMRIVDQDREPVFGAFVKFEDARGTLELKSQPKGEDTIGMTDKAGELLAYGLPADRITIVLNVPLVRGAPVGRHEVRLAADLRVQPEGVQEFTIERRFVRCLVLSLREMDAPPDTTVYDTNDEASKQIVNSLIEQDLMRSIGKPLTVTVTAADGALVDTAHCEPNPEIPKYWRVTSSVCDSKGEPTSWLAVALPATESKAAIVAEGYQTDKHDMPAGDDHLKRYVILRPAGP